MRSATRAHPEIVDTFARRFGVEVIDAYGATEGGVAVNRDVEEHAGALGQVGDTVQVVDDDGRALPRARFAPNGTLLNADECVGEIVNTAGAGPFEGYYNNPEANERTLRFGWYWTGDLGYLDDDRYLYFAGRNADWLRVDGENFPAQPIESTVARYPGVVLAVVYGVPDDQAGDQVMAGLVPRARRHLRPRPLRVVARRADGHRTEVASPLRAPARRPAHDGNQQDRQAHPGAPEVAQRPRRRRPRLRPGSRGGQLPAPHRRR